MKTLITQEQKRAFLAFVDSKISTTKNDFIKAMHERLHKNIPLTPNMISALQRCVDGEKNLKSQNQSSQDLPKEKKKFKIKKWLMNQLGLDSRYVKVEIERESARAYKVNGHADYYKTSSCMRCGRTLTQPASITVGFGADCASKMGVDYPEELNGMNEEAAEVYRTIMQGKLRDQKIDGWLPKSQIEYELEIDDEEENEEVS